MSRYPAILNLGFRLFFFSATAFAVLAMLAWLAVYQGHHATVGGLVAQWWHGHEMVYGYAAAVVTGFLFTAVQNWTGVPMPHGWPLFCYRGSRRGCCLPSHRAGMLLPPAAICSLPSAAFMASPNR